MTCEDTILVKNKSTCYPGTREDVTPRNKQRITMHIYRTNRQTVFDKCSLKNLCFNTFHRSRWYLKVGIKYLILKIFDTFLFHFSHVLKPFDLLRLDMRIFELE